MWLWACGMLETMTAAGVSPDKESFAAAFRACRNADRYKAFRPLFKTMRVRAHWAAQRGKAGKEARPP